MNFILYVIDLPLSSSFLIDTEKVIYFSVFCPKHSNCPSNSSDSSLIINHHDIPQEFLLVFYILNYKYHKRLLYIFQYSDNDLLL